MAIAILLAAGKSARFGKDKLFALLNGKPVMSHSLALLEDFPLVGKIIIVTTAARKKRLESLFPRIMAPAKKHIVVLGGRTRYESVKNAVFSAAGKGAEFFLIHNAANPLASEDELKRLFAGMKKGVSGIGLARPITSTLKQVMPGGRVKSTVAREGLYEMETPQLVRAKDFRDACKKTPSGDFSDDLSVLEAAKKKVKVVLASWKNRKITRPEDLEMLMSLIEGQCHCEPQRSNLVGIGEDSHKFSANRLLRPTPHRPRNDSLVLGGVRIPKYPALEAESDGDVMIHALCNAIFSALGGGSLGTYATEMQRSGIRDSREYLKYIMEKIKREHRKIAQCSFSIEAKNPVIDPLSNGIKKNLSKLLGISPKCIGITATSGEGLTPFGRGEAIKCTATVLLCSE